MDAIALLKQDHRLVEDLFARYEASGKRAGKQRQKLVDQMISALSQHAAIEEQLLYPTMRQLGEKGNELALEGLEEHLVAKWTLDALSKLKPDDERFDAKVEVLMTNVRHHVKEEEREFFPFLRKALDRASLEQLGEHLMHAKEVAPTRPRPRMPDQPPGNLVLGAVAGAIDKGRDLLMGRRTAPPQQAAKTARAGTSPRRAGSSRSRGGSRSRSGGRSQRSSRSKSRR